MPVRDHQRSTFCGAADSYFVTMNLFGYGASGNILVTRTEFWRLQDRLACIRTELGSRSSRYQETSTTPTCTKWPEKRRGESIN
jgi:hypothetical protein